MTDALDELERDLQAVTAELVDVQDQLLAMYNLAGALRGYLEPDALLGALVNEAVRLVGTSGGFTTLGGDQGRLVTSAGFRLEPADARQLVRLCSGATNVIVTTAPSVGRVMLASIPLHDRPSAVIGLVRDAGASFTAPEQKLMAAIAAYGGAQLEGVLLHQETLRRARVELEFELARSIQADLSAAVPAGHPGVDVYAESRAAHVVGGDFFDFAPRSEERLVCLLGDVAGKGIPAALLVAMTRSIIRTASRKMEGSAPGLVLGQANADLYQDFSKLSRFATVFLACFEYPARRVVMASAGHSPVIYRPADGRAELVYPRPYRSACCPTGRQPTRTSASPRATCWSWRPTGSPRPRTRGRASCSGTTASSSSLKKSRPGTPRTSPRPCSGPPTPSAPDPKRTTTERC